MLEGLGKRLRAYAGRDGRGYPDWALRYAPIARGLGGKIGEGWIVELGANENGLARFMDGRIVAVDIDGDHLRAARANTGVATVQADMAALPFASGKVACCVSVDTLEHLPEGKREAAVAEILRVLRPSGPAVVSFPSGPAAVAAEARVQEAYAALTGRRLHWFEEHAQAALPDPAAVLQQCATLAPRRHAALWKNANLRYWTWMWRVLIAGWPGRGNALFQALVRLLTPLASRFHWGRCYRTILWVDGEAKAPEETTGERTNP